MLKLSLCVATAACFFMSCDNAPVAPVTHTKQGVHKAKHDRTMTDIDGMMVKLSLAHQ